MATIVQPPLFSWESVDRSPEILRLQRVLDVLPDNELIEILLQERKGKRNDYPLEAVWNSLIAGIVFGHESIESLRRELLRNGELRDICGFDPILGEKAVPSKFAYSRFLGKLYVHKETINAMFHSLVDALSGLLEDFGVDLAVGGKAIPTHGFKDETVRDGQYGRVVRVPLERNRRIFLPTHRHSRGFRNAYKKRSSVERVNSRIDQVYGFEHHFIRGIKKMKLRISLALIVMLATAKAWILADRKEKMRSLVQVA